MEYRGIEILLLRTIPHGWRWQFEAGGTAKDGTSFDRANALFKAMRAIDAFFRQFPPDRSTWQVGQRVSRIESEEGGTITDGNIKVKWDGGSTSYFTHGSKANVRIAE